MPGRFRRRVGAGCREDVAAGPRCSCRWSSHPASNTTDGGDCKRAGRKRRALHAVTLLGFDRRSHFGRIPRLPGVARRSRLSTKLNAAAPSPCVAVSLLCGILSGCAASSRAPQSRPVAPAATATAKPAMTRAAPLFERRENTTRAKPPQPFEGRQRVSFDEFLVELQKVALELEQSPVLQQDYRALLDQHGLADSPALFREYVRVKMVFEATRDGGLWGLTWSITNRPGRSDRIWRSWQNAPVPSAGEWGETAVAECDELSSLFAFLVRRLGVKKAGWLDGGPKHVVAAWTVRRPGKRDVRIVVPTSQVFLSREASLGMRELNAYRAKIIWDYWRRDVPGDFELPAPLARYFIRQLRRYGGSSQAALQKRRNQHGGS